jgi:hypothetical protein
MSIRAIVDLSVRDIWRLEGKAGMAYRCLVLDSGEGI